MQNNIAGPGQNLPLPTATYPNYPAISNVSTQHGTNFFDLAPGGTYTIPAGYRSVYIGQTCTLQIFDPILLTWRAYGTTQLRSQDIQSDGVNFRIANLTGCAIGAGVTNAGTGYTGVPTVTPSAGGSTWQAIVGGAVNTTVVVDTGGSGYTVPPLVVFPKPPVGGIPATGYAVMSGGAVASITITQQGAGYLTAPACILAPSPQDPNLNNITNATAHTTLTGAGTVTGILCLTNGAAQATPATPITLTIAGGGGASAAATAIMCMTIASVTVSAGGTTYKNLVGATSFGGYPAIATAYADLSISNGILFPPIQAQMTLVGSGGVVQQAGQVMFNSGLFTGTPLLVAIGGDGQAVLTPTMGSGHGVFFDTPL